MPEDTRTDTTQAPPDDEVADAIECAAEILRDELKDRYWLRVLTPILAIRATESREGDRCQLEFDLMFNAACKRACRILRSDLDR